MRAHLWVVLALLAWLASPAMAGMTLSMDDPVSLADCDNRVHLHPGAIESYLCYWIVSRRGPWSDAARRLEALLALDPANNRARLYLGAIEADRFRPEAESHYREAIRGFQAGGDLVGEFYGRITLHSFLADRGRVDEADRELERLLAIAAATGDPEHLLSAGLVEAWNAFGHARYAEAWALYGRLAADHGARAPGWLRYRLLAGQGQAAWSLGRLEEAMDFSRRAADLLHASGNRYSEAIHEYFMAEIGWELAAGGRRTWDEARALAAQALESALAGQHPSAEALARMLIARDPALDLATRMTETRKGLALARRNGTVEDVCLGLRLQAAQLIEQDADANLEAALGRLDESIALARQGARPESVAAGLLSRAAAGGERRPFGDVVSDYQAAIAEIERMRDLQWDRLVRARFLWNWASAYHRLAAHLARRPDAAPPGREEMDRAFSTIERLRARLLADILDPAREEPAAADSPDDRERSALLARIVQVQRSLLSSNESGQGRAAALETLAQLENREADVRRRLARASRSRSMLASPEVPPLARIQEALAPDQALVSFQVPPQEGRWELATPPPAPWAFVVTRDHVAIVGLPESRMIEEQVEMFLGLLERRDGMEETAAAELYHLLLEDVLAAAGDPIRRLVIIPDGMLHRLPFGALRSRGTREPLVTTHAVSVVPSATLWYRWNATRSPASPAVLALADPALPADAGRAGSRRSAALARELRLGPLPRARDEVRAFAGRLGRDSVVLEGTQASEHQLKTTPLDRFGILHIAAHALVDDLNPRRSAVLLAPGAPDQDGLLQMSEIADLDLEGTVVILSACSSASGELTTGEGVIGLASAFFQSGARTVIAGLWPLRDREAARLIDRFGAHLASGRSVESSLAMAQRDLLRRGLPPDAWAGMIVLGDGSVTPIPGGRRSAAPFVAAGMLIALVAGLAAAGFMLARRVRVRSRTP